MTESKYQDSFLCCTARIRNMTPGRDKNTKRSPSDTFPANISKPPVINAGSKKIRKILNLFKLDFINAKQEGESNRRATILFHRVSVNLNLKSCWSDDNLNFYYYSNGSFKFLFSGLFSKLIQKKFHYFFVITPFCNDMLIAIVFA